MNTDIRIAILTLSRGIIQSKADPLRREKLCPNLLSPKFADAQMSSNFLPKFFVLKYIEPKVLAHKFLNIKVQQIVEKWWKQYRRPSAISTTMLYKPLLK